MFFVKCVPFVGTAVTAGEAIGALIDGDGKTFLAKTAQTCVGGVLDATLILSAGTSSVVTSPLKAGLLEGGKIAGKKAIEKMVVQEATKITTNIAARAVTDFVAEKAGGGGERKLSGGGRGGYGRGGSRQESRQTGPSTTPGGDGDDERPHDSYQWCGDGDQPPASEVLTSDDLTSASLTRNLSSEIRTVTRGPITQVATRTVNGSSIVDYLRANIRHEHLNRGEPTSLDSRYSEGIRNLGLTVDGISDTAGHILARILGGCLFENLFPQNRSINSGFYRSDIEASIQNFLKRYHDQNARVEYQARLVYRNASQTRPFGLYVLVRYYIGDRLATSEELYGIPNCGVENPLLEWIPNPPPNWRFND